MIRAEELESHTETQSHTGEILSLPEIRRRAAKLISDPAVRDAIDIYLVLAAGLDQLVEGVANKRLFDQRLEEAVARSQRTKTPLTLIGLDLDNFKPVNDTLGHKTGDKLLQEVGKLLKKGVRITDTVARLGGDEFGIILPDTSLVSGLVVADRILASIPDLTPKTSDKPLPPLAVSIGIAQFAPGEDAETLFKRADAGGLLPAKRGGKNVIGLALHPTQHFAVSGLRSMILNNKDIEPENRIRLINHILDNTLLIGK